MFGNLHVVLLSCYREGTEAEGSSASVSDPNEPDTYAEGRAECYQYHHSRYMISKDNQRHVIYIISQMHDE